MIDDNGFRVFCVKCHGLTEIVSRDMIVSEQCQCGHRFAQCLLDAATELRDACLAKKVKH